VFCWSVRINKDGVEEPRTDDDIEADALKQIRNDGGQLGPAARYKQIIDGSSSTAAAAAAINDHVTRRIKHIRIYAASAINELRRRRAGRAGIDPMTVDYLAVR
jgi:hypothetical protein